MISNTIKISNAFYRKGIELYIKCIILILNLIVQHKAFIKFKIDVHQSCKACRVIYCKYKLFVNLLSSFDNNKK